MKCFRPNGDKPLQSIGPDPWWITPQSQRWAAGGTGPNPTEPSKAGSKHHLITNNTGTPLAALLTEETTPVPVNNQSMPPGLEWVHCFVARE